MLNQYGTAQTTATFIGNVNPIRYRGYYYDTETKLYYLQSRYYDPETCRFVNMDGYVQTGSDGLLDKNAYAYCEGDPVNYSDPTGKYKIYSADFVGPLQEGDVRLTSDIKVSDIIAMWNDLTDATNKAGTATLIHAFDTSERPKNIGPGSYAKYVSQKKVTLLKMSSALGKAVLHLRLLCWQLMSETIFTTIISQEPED